MSMVKAARTTYSCSFKSRYIYRFRQTHGIKHSLIDIPSTSLSSKIEYFRLTTLRTPKRNTSGVYLSKPTILGIRARLRQSPPSSLTWKNETFSKSLDKPIHKKTAINGRSLISICCLHTTKQATFCRTIMVGQMPRPFRKRQIAISQARTTRAFTQPPMLSSRLPRSWVIRGEPRITSLLILLRCKPTV